MIPRIQMGLERCLQRHPQQMLRSLGSFFRRNRSDNGHEVNFKLPERRQQLKSLKEENFDVLVIGGGAIGCGCALEAASRGLKTALIEAGDFGSGASCKSSKLVEGGSSYLQAAIQGADLQQIFMLQQVLTERATMLRIAPHLNRVQPMLMPIYSPLRLPFYWLGLKLYDAMAGMANVRASHFLSQEETLNEFPLLRRQGLLGSLVYYDGQMDDARMCLALAMTAAKNDATVANYVRLQKLLLPEDEQTCRKAVVEDTLTETAFTITSRCLINATGAGTDAVRKLDDNKATSIALPKMGTHISLPGHFGSPQCGLLFPSGQLDQETMFMLPFENRIVVGSVLTEPEVSNCTSTTPRNEAVESLLQRTREVFDECAQLRPDHVLSAWTGVMPSIMCPSSKENNGNRPGDTELVPNFLIEVSGNQMITLAGGRWSSYRIMASDAIDAAVEHCCLEPQVEVSFTQNLLLDGAEDYYSMLPLDLVQNFDLPMDVAQHLSESYGCNAFQVLERTKPCDRQRLHPQFPYIRAEVDFACQREYACHLVDVIARRLRVAFVDASAAYQIMPTVLEIMAKHLSWDKLAQEAEFKSAQKFLKQQMGLGSSVKYNPPFSDEKQRVEKTARSLQLLTQPDCSEYKRVLAKASSNIDTRCHKQGKIVSAIAGTVPQMKADHSPILGASTSLASYDHSLAPRQDVATILNEAELTSRPANEKAEASTSETDELQPYIFSVPEFPEFVESRQANNLPARISEFQRKKTSSVEPTTRPKFENRPSLANALAQVVGTTAVGKKLQDSQSGNPIQQQATDTGSNTIPGNLVAQSKPGSQVSSVKQDSTVISQVVKYMTQVSPSSPASVGSISVPARPKKGIAVHTITDTEVNRKVNPGTTIVNCKRCENFENRLDKVNRNVNPRDTVGHSKGRADNLSNSLEKYPNRSSVKGVNLEYKKKTAHIDHTMVGQLSIPGNYSCPVNDGSVGTLNDEATLQQNVASIRSNNKTNSIKKERPVANVRHNSSIPATNNRGFSLVQEPKRNPSVRKSAEAGPSNADIMRQSPDVNLLKERLFAKYRNISDIVSKTKISIHDPNRDTSDRKSTAMSPSKEAQFSKGKLFIRKTKFPLSNRSTIDIRTNSVSKSPAMRLQSLFYKDKHFQVKGENSNLNVSIKSKSRIEELPRREPPVAYHQKGTDIDSRRSETPTFVEESSRPRLFSKDGIFARKGKDPSTSNAISKPDVNPKLR